MSIANIRNGLLAVAVGVALAGCATAPSGRSQLLLVSETEMTRLGGEAFAQMKGKDRLSSDARLQARARCVVDALVTALPPRWQGLEWEVQVFADDSANAFALPGGKIGVNQGLFKIAGDADELAAVLGHEIGHVVFRHANERVSRSTLAEVGLSTINAYAGARTSPETTRTLIALLGAGAQVGVLLPFSREQEREADRYGQELMAEAGFDPEAAVRLWRKMSAAAGSGRGPELLSSHPNPENRLGDLTGRIPELAPVHTAARARGRTPNCG